MRPSWPMFDPRNLTPCTLMHGPMPDPMPPRRVRGTEVLDPPLADGPLAFESAAKLIDLAPRTSAPAPRRWDTAADAGICCGDPNALSTTMGFEFFFALLTYEASSFSICVRGKAMCDVCELPRTCPKCADIKVLLRRVKVPKIEIRWWVSYPIPPPPILCRRVHLCRLCVSRLLANVSFTGIQMFTGDTVTYSH